MVVELFIHRYSVVANPIRDGGKAAIVLFSRDSSARFQSWPQRGSRARISASRRLCGFDWRAGGGPHTKVFDGASDNESNDVSDELVGQAGTSDTGTPRLKVFTCPDDPNNVDAVFNEVGRGGDAGDTVPMDHFSFNFSRIED